MKLVRSCLTITLMLGACSPAPAVSTESLSARVDSVFADIDPGAPGCAAAVYHQGELVLAKAWGLANVEEGRAITERTTFNLGSASKPFTALAALMLEEKGRLSLDDDVRRHVPELPDYGTPIRVRDLLQHTSGLRDYGTLEVLLDREIATMPHFLGLMVRQRQLNFTPGTQHEYSHSDFVLLGLIIERIVGEPFGAYLEREVLRPLGMTGSLVHDDRGMRIPERAFGHEKVASAFRVIFPESRIVAGENLYTSTADLLRWDRALAEGERGQRPLVARMLSRPTLPGGDTIPYAYGIRLEEYRGLTTESRGGHVPGMMSAFVRFPEEDVAVAALCNGEHLDAGQRALRAADAILGDKLEPRRPMPVVPPEVRLSAAELDRYVGAYASNDAVDLSRFVIVDGKLAERLMDTVQTFTARGNGVFTGDGSPGDFRIRFSEDSAGSMRLEWLSEGEVDGSARRLSDAEAWRPERAALTAYEGMYVSDDIDAVWHLVSRDGSIALRRPAAKDAPFVPHSRDVFTRGFGDWSDPLVARMEFGRDAAGRVTHFTLSTPPGEDVVRNLRFVRAPLTQLPAR